MPDKQGPTMKSTIEKTRWHAPFGAALKGSSLEALDLEQRLDSMRHGTVLLFSCGIVDLSVEGWDLRRALLWAAWVVLQGTIYLFARRRGIAAAQTFGAVGAIAATWFLLALATLGGTAASPFLAVMVLLPLMIALLVPTDTVSSALGGAASVLACCLLLLHDALAPSSIVSWCAALLLATGFAAYGSVRTRRRWRAELEAERARHASEERFRALIEKASDMLSVVDAQGRLLFASPSALALLGPRSEQAIGKDTLELVHREDQAAAREALASLQLDPAATVRAELRYRCAKDGGWRVLECVGRNLLDHPAVRGVVVNARDVTETRQMELALRRSEEQFRQAQKLESIGRVAGGVAHDFNNILTVILSCSEALRRDLHERATVDPEDVEAIAVVAERARELTGQLLAFARRQVISPVRLDLNGMVRASEKMLRRLLGEDLELIVHLGQDLWPVRCDPGQVEQVLLNLAVNARDATPGAGKLVIETSNADVGERRAASNPGMRPGAYVRLAVRDSGTGMTPDVKEHLFEPFFTTKPRGKGTGLGLATVYGIVNQSGGFILVDSDVGHGTTFEVYLPRTLEAAPAESPVARPTATTGDETILVVEDDDHVRDVATRALGDAGYRVFDAASGAAALEVAPQAPAPLHLVVADVVLPGLNGRQVADELRREHPETRVLYVSGHTREVVLQRGVADSRVEFLAKPFTASSLLTRVRAVLDAR